jgi:nucleoprotein TPR
MAAATVDVGYLAASYSVPETTLQSLLSTPTIDLVQELLTHIEAKAREFEDLQSEKLKADVELDNAVQTGEQRARALKATADKAQKEAEELRQKIAQEGAYTGATAAGGRQLTMSLQKPRDSS